MISPNWRSTSVSLSALSREAQLHYGSAFEFLKRVGVVPEEVRSMPLAKVKFNFDPEEVPAEYLASAAYEWDTWGPSDPEDFVRALYAELIPARRDFIAAILTSLGRSVQAE